jgi:glycosyltransferase involved in cell wall biosynthesis
MFRQLLEDATSHRKMKGLPAKDRLLVFPADIRPLKGHMDFFSALVAKSAQRPTALQRLRGLTVVLAGGCDGNETYCAEVVTLTQKISAEGIVNIVIADQLKDEELVQLYAAALGIVLFSRIDCNPRAVYEGFVTDTPFFATEATNLPRLVHHLGHLSDGDTLTLPERLADFVDFSEAGGFSGRPREFAVRHLSEAENYRKLVEWMDQKYVNGKLLQPIVKSEDALSKAFGGLGMMLGGGAGGIMGEIGRRAADGQGGTTR